MAVTVFDQHFLFMRPSSGGNANGFMRAAFAEQIGAGLIIDTTTCCRGFEPYLFVQAPGGTGLSLIYEGAWSDECGVGSPGAKTWSSGERTRNCPGYYSNLEMYASCTISDCDLEGTVLEVRRVWDDHVFARYRNDAYGWNHGAATILQLVFAECDECAESFFYSTFTVGRQWPTHLTIGQSYLAIPTTNLATPCGGETNAAPSSASILAASDGTCVGAIANGLAGSTLNFCRVGGSTTGVSSSAGTNIPVLHRNPPGTDIYYTAGEIDIPAMTNWAAGGSVLVTNRGPVSGRLTVDGPTLTGQYKLRLIRKADDVEEEFLSNAWRFVAMYGAPTDGCESKTLNRLSEHVWISGGVFPGVGENITVVCALRIADGAEMFPSTIDLSVTP